MLIHVFSLHLISHNAHVSSLERLFFLFVIMRCSPPPKFSGRGPAATEFFQRCKHIDNEVGLPTMCHFFHPRSLFLFIFSAPVSSELCPLQTSLARLTVEGGVRRRWVLSIRSYFSGPCVSQKQICLPRTPAPSSPVHASYR